MNDVEVGSVYWHTHVGAGLLEGLSKSQLQFELPGAYGVYMADGGKRRVWVKGDLEVIRVATVGV